jgi:hypothetical protein
VAGWSIEARFVRREVETSLPSTLSKALRACHARLFVIVNRFFLIWIVAVLIMVREDRDPAAIEAAAKPADAGARRGRTTIP